jgi:PIN domain nuclease of toxin-antitoxin system
MRILLDTHAFLWWVKRDIQLSEAAISAIADRSNAIFLSVASAWEIIIKVRTGKLILPESSSQYITSRLTECGFQSLRIEMNHVLKITDLPDHHRDPFDRILIAQSLVEEMPIVTVDSKISQYTRDVIW